MKAVAAAFLADVLDIQIGVSAQGLKHLIEQSFGFADVLLVNRNPVRGSDRRGVARLPKGQRAQEKGG